MCRGNPHATPKNNDPYHVSVTLGVKNTEGKDRVVSAHVYPDGRVKFSKTWGPVKGTRDPEAPDDNGPAK